MTDYLPSYKKSGSGPALIFLHGLGGNQHSFDRQIAVLSKRFCCISWDCPGYNDSPMLEQMSFDNLARCLSNLRAHLDVDVFALIGHSLGGMIAQTWLHSGGRCEALVLAQTTPRFGKPGSSWNEEFLAARLGPLDAGLTPADFAKPLIQSMFHDPQQTAKVAEGIATMATLSADAYRNIIECLVTFDQLENLSKIKPPTLCLAADGDKTAPPKAVAAMAEQIPEAKFECLTNAGHLAYIETPDAFTQAIDSFLVDKSTN